MRGTLRWQLLSRAFAIVAILLLGLGVSQYFAMSRELYDAKVELLQSRLHNIPPDEVEAVRGGESLKAAAPSFMRGMVDLGVDVAIINAEGVAILTKGGPEGLASVPRRSRAEYRAIVGGPEWPSGYAILKDSAGNEHIAVYRRLGSDANPCGLIQVSAVTQDVRGVLRRQLLVYAFSSLVALLLGGLLLGRATSHSLRPLYSVTGTMRGLDADGLGQRLPESTGQLEVDSLSRAFNGLLERIAASFREEQLLNERMRQFTSDASHELRTPLTSIRGFAEVLLMGAAADKAQLEQSLRSIVTESERLSKLVNDLLVLARLDQHAPLAMAVEDLGGIVRELQPQLRLMCGGRDLIVNGTPGVTVNANRDKMKQVVINLVHNAAQHTDAVGGRVTVTVTQGASKDGARAILEVADNGTGIPAASLEHIFDRFYRSESHRSRDHGGYGLGLSIVKAILDAHGGEICVQSEVGKGSSFVVSLGLFSGVAAEAQGHFIPSRIL